MTLPVDPDTGGRSAVTSAILARLRGVLEPVFDGHVPLDEQGRPLAERYAVLWMHTPERAAHDLTGAIADRHTRRWQITSVGRDRNQVEWVATRCQDALLDEPVVVEGWELGNVVHTSSGPIRPDRDIPGDPVFYAAGTYKLPATH